MPGKITRPEPSQKPDPNTPSDFTAAVDGVLDNLGEAGLFVSGADKRDRALLRGQKPQPGQLGAPAIQPPASGPTDSVAFGMKTADWLRELSPESREAALDAAETVRIESFGFDEEPIDYAAFDYEAEPEVEEEPEAEVA
jgi:hypothetical protein